MKYLGHILTLSLFSLPVFANYPDEINYPHYESIYRGHADELSRLMSRYQNLDSDTRRLYAEIQNLQITYNNYSNEKVSILNSLKRLSDETRQLVVQRDRLIRDERDLNQRANRARSEYEQLKREVDNESRRLKPLQDQVSRTENEVRSAKSSHDQEVRRLQSAQKELRDAQTTLSRVRSDISRLEGVSNRTPAQQTSLDNLYRHKSSLETQISRKSSEVSQHQSSVNRLAQQVSTKESELRDLKNRYNSEARRLSQLQASLDQAHRNHSDLENRLRNTRTSLTNTDRRLSSIKVEVSRLESRKRDIDRAQDSLRYQIDNSQRRYSQQVYDLENLNRDIERKKVVVNDAQYAFERRADLYNRYLSDAMELGRSQVVSATQKGTTQGEKDAQKKGSALGTHIGQISGLASGNLWGAVRAEVVAYHEGYDIGYNSPRTDAQNAADRDAAKAAKAHVESVLRPIYFEEVVQEEIKKPFFVQKRLEVPTFFAFPRNNEFNHRLEVSPQELEASDRLRTTYDSVITQYKKEKEEADRNLDHNQNPINSYAQQANYPYDSFSCLNVYKGVHDFKEACEEQFYNHYASTFETAAYESYLEQFKSFFDEAFENTFNTVVTKQYDSSYARAYEVSKVFGEQEGRRVMYNEAYELQYKISYSKYLEQEKTRVRGEVAGEFAQFIEKNPLLTMISLDAPSDLIAGDTITLSSLIRNLGKTKGAIAELNIVRVNGAEILTKKVTTPVIDARSQKQIAGPVVRILPQLETGKRISVEVEATLPGDTYQSARREKLVFEKKVTVNPQQDLNLNVDYSPSIRNILRRFLIHSLSVDVTPKFENLKTDLDVQLVALTGAEDIEFKVSQQKVQKMNKGSKRNIKFSYVFKDSAKGKTVRLAMQFLYKGKVVQTEIVELKPH